MVQSEFELRLPRGDELPSSDDTPVDNELQNLIPNNLGVIIGFLWATRNDWFFGVDMAIYHTTGSNPTNFIVPDGFLSLGVPRIRAGNLRRSYVVWEENQVVPIWVMEIVSETYGGEYDEKMRKYASLGVLYYVIYNPEFWRRHQRQPFEVYRLVDGGYQRQVGEPVWMPEIGLGIGRGIGSYWGLQREWLYWYEESGNRYLSPEEQLQQYRDRFGELPPN